MKWISKKLNGIYHFFGPLLTFSFAVIFTAMIILGIYIIYAWHNFHCQGLILPQLPDNNTPTPWYQNIDIFGIFENSVLGAFFLALGMSLIYFILGIVRHFINAPKKNRGNSVKILLLRGIIGAVIAVLLYYAFAFEFVFMPLCL